jgi:hypothetical protein
MQRQSIWSTRTNYVLGQDTFIMHHKVLRIISCFLSGLNSFKQICHVLTFGDDHDNRQGQCWMPTPSPPMFVNSNVHSHGVTIRGSTYFLASDIFSTYDMLCPFNIKMDNMKIEGIALFDFEKEQWWPATLQGPHEITSAHRCKLVELNNTLVLVFMVHLHFDHTYMDFWFADDLKKGLWVKKLVLRPKSREPCAHLPLVIDVRRVVVLDDGRIVFSYYVSSKEPHWLTRAYDPRTKVYTDLPQLGGRSIVGVYTKKPSVYLASR